MTAPSRPALQISTILAYNGGFKEAARSVAEWKRPVSTSCGSPRSTDSTALPDGYLSALTERVQIGSGIMNIYSRTPSLIAMTGRGHRRALRRAFPPGPRRLGPQVIEGFYGVPYANHSANSRDRGYLPQNLEARGPSHEASNFTLPLHERSMQTSDHSKNNTKRHSRVSIEQPVRNEIPIWIASLGRENVEMTAAIADGGCRSSSSPNGLTRSGGLPAARRAKRDPSRGELMISAGGLLAIRRRR